jgi:hypothetical protein
LRGGIGDIGGGEFVAVALGLDCGELGAGAGGGALDGGDAALEAFEVAADGDETLGEREVAFDDIPAAAGEGDVGGLEEVVLELGFDEAHAAQDPLVADDGIDEVAFAGVDGVKFAEIFRCELVEVAGVLAADGEGFGVDAGLNGVAARDGFAGGRSGPGRMLRISTICFDLLLSGHKRSPVRV